MSKSQKDLGAIFSVSKPQIETTQWPMKQLLSWLKYEPIHHTKTASLCVFIYTYPFALNIRKQMNNPCSLSRAKKFSKHETKNNS
jgi:hypothetical protein